MNAISEISNDTLIQELFDCFFEVSCGHVQDDDDLFEWFDSRGDRLPSELLEEIDSIFKTDFFNEPGFEWEPFTMKKMKEILRQNTKE